MLEKHQLHELKNVFVYSIHVNYDETHHSTVHVFLFSLALISSISDILPELYYSSSAAFIGINL